MYIFMVLRILLGLSLFAIVANLTLHVPVLLGLLYPSLAGAGEVGAVRVYLALAFDVITAGILLFLVSRLWRERARLRVGLAGSESRTRSIFATAVDAIIIIDARGLIQAANPATEALFGYTVAEMLGRNVKMLMPEPYRGQHDGYIGNYLRSGEAKIIGIGREVLGVRKDGSIFPAYLSVSEMYQDDQRMFTGILHDITDLKEAERKLEVERNFISAILDTAGAAVVVLDRCGRIVNFNKESSDISGYEFEEVYDRVIWDVLIPGWQIGESRGQFRSLVRGAYPSTYESYWLTKDGRERLIQWTHTVLESPVDRNQVEFVVSTGIDITEKRSSENELSRLSRKIIEIQEEERNRISSEIHDVIGQSLIALKFMVDDVLYRVTKNEPVIMDRLEDINVYINQTVQQAREISHNLSPIALKKIGLSHAIQELVNTFATGTSYRFEIDLEDLDAFFRSRWEINVYRIVQEALTNIFKHAGATEIAIQARLIGSSLFLKIKDNGVGFDTDELDGGRSASGSSGIGQLIMRERAHLLGGHLKIISRKNHGTELVLEIPA